MTSIKIILVDPKGQETEMDVLDTYTIEQCKKQYYKKVNSSTNNQWKYNGRVIKDNNQTLKDLEVEDEDRIVVNSEVRGGI
jgi:hypothetical protein